MDSEREIEKISENVQKLLIGFGRLEERFTASDILFERQTAGLIDVTNRMTSTERHFDVAIARLGSAEDDVKHLQASIDRLENRQEECANTNAKEFRGIGEELKRIETIMNEQEKMIERNQKRILMLLSFIGAILAAAAFILQHVRFE